MDSETTGRCPGVEGRLFLRDEPVSHQVEGLEEDAGRHVQDHFKSKWFLEPFSQIVLRGWELWSSGRYRLLRGVGGSRGSTSDWWYRTAVVLRITRSNRSQEIET